MGAATEGVHFPSKTTFFRHQKNLIPKIEGNCNDHLNNAAKSVFNEKKFDLSGDGTYPTARDSWQCTYTCMDCVKNKVVNVRSISKNEFDVSSNMLESNAAKLCFDEIVDKYGSDSCSTFTSDNDNKSFNQAKKAGLVAERRFDPRHGFKSLGRGFYKMTNKFEHEEKEPSILDENKTEIISWAVYLVNNIDDKYLRGLMWKNTPDHLVGRHENCNHGPLPPDHVDWEVGKRNPELFQIMSNFFKRTEKFIINCENKNSSQCNESLNNLISMLSPKRLHFAKSYDVRVLMACGIYNESHFYSNLLMELQLDRYIPQKSMEDIIKYEEDRENRNLVKHTPEYREKKKKQRSKAYKKNKTQTPGDYNLDKSEMTFE